MEAPTSPIQQRPLQPLCVRAYPDLPRPRADEHLHGAPAALEVVPVDGPLGVYIRGLDISRPLNEATIRGIEDSWCVHLVFVFRGQSLTITQQLDFAAQFGEILEGNKTSRSELSRQYRGILELSTVDQDGRQRERGLGNAEAFWHTDRSYKPVPPAGSFLFSREVPDVRGNTCFSNSIPRADMSSLVRRQLVPSGRQNTLMRSAIRGPPRG